MPRLLVCKECKTIEELPLWDGDPKDEPQDQLLDNLVRRHVQKHGETEDSAMLLNVPDEAWNDPNDQLRILTNLQERWTGFVPSAYHLMNTFAEDALRCYNKHHRPTGGCIDYCEPNKLLTSNLWHSEMDDFIDKSDRKKYSLSGRTPVYLCQWCPVETWVTTKKRNEKHLYDRVPGEID